MPPSPTWSLMFPSSGWGWSKEWTAFASYLQEHKHGLDPQASNTEHSDQLTLMHESVIMIFIYMFSFSCSSAFSPFDLPLSLSLSLYLYYPCPHNISCKHRDRLFTFSTKIFLLVVVQSWKGAESTGSIATGRVAVLPGVRQHKPSLPGSTPPTTRGTLGQVTTLYYFTFTTAGCHGYTNI